MATRAPRRRPAPRRQRPHHRRRRPALAVIVVGLLLAGAFAAAAIAGLFTVTRQPAAGPYRFPTPAANAGAAQRSD